MMRTLVASLVLVVVLGACGSANPPSSPAGVTGPGASPFGAPSPTSVIGPATVAPSAGSASAAPSSTSAAPSATAAPPSPSGTATPAAGSSSQPAGSATPLCTNRTGCVLAPGRYAWTQGTAVLQFAVESGWAVDYASASGFDLARVDTGRSTTTVAFLEQVYANACDPAPRHVNSAVGDVLGWLRLNTGLHVSNETPVTVGGHPGTRVHVNAGNACASGDVPLFALDGELFALDSSDEADITVIDLGGRALSVIVAGPSATFRSFSSVAQKVVDSFTSL